MDNTILNFLIDINKKKKSNTTNHHITNHNTNFNTNIFKTITKKKIKYVNKCKNYTILEFIKTKNYEDMFFKQEEIIRYKFFTPKKNIKHYIINK